MSVVFYFGQLNLILYLPLLLHALLESGETLASRQEVAGRLREYVVWYGVSERGRAAVMRLKTEIEIYIGVYLIGVWVIRRSHIFGVVVYWQVLRVRYMIGGLMREAFERVDRVVRDGGRGMPGPVRDGVKKVREVMIYMGDINNQSR